MLVILGLIWISLSLTTNIDGYTTDCPAHTIAIFNGGLVYNACRPFSCICLNQTLSNVEDCRGTDLNETSRKCIDGYSFQTLLTQFISPSCLWVRLVRDEDFDLDIENGTITEINTNLQHSMEDYLYNPEYKEAYICRENLLPGDKTDGIILWCSILTVDDGNYTIANGSLIVPGLSDAISPKYYNINQNSSTVSICFNSSLEFLRSLRKSLIDKRDFTINSHFELTLKGVLGHEDSVYPPGNYWVTYDEEHAIVVFGENEPVIVPASTFARNLYIYHIISAIFCFFTLLFHLAIPKINLHTKSLLCHVFSMMLMYIAFTFKRFYSEVQSKPAKCLLFGFFYVTIIGTFLWLNIIAYELWKVFASLRGIATKSISDQRLRLFLKSLYAWGIPLVILCVIFGISYNENLQEKLGLNFMTDIHEAFPINTTFSWIFIHGPMSAILFINLLLFLLTILNIRKARRGTKMLNKNVNRKL
ncbi:hypothetical protein CHUAL_010588 [Chamberlinius hualienensis]